MAIPGVCDRCGEVNDYETLFAAWEELSDASWAALINKEGPAEGAVKALTIATEGPVNQFDLGRRISRYLREVKYCECDDPVLY